MTATVYYLRRLRLAAVRVAIWIVKAIMFACRPVGAATDREALALGVLGSILARALGVENWFAWVGVGFGVMYVFGLLRLLLFGGAK
jgi:hypothetical protein